MIGRTEKVVSLAEAADRVPNGTRLALGGFAIYQHPMAFVRELVRLRRRNLTVVGTVNGIDVDMLSAAGALRRVETSYVGLEQFGLARCFRRAVESGAVDVIDYSEVLSFDRFRASQDNWTFLPCYYLAGTDLARRNPDIREATCPLSGKPFHAVPPADPDVVVVQASAADRYGNAIVGARRQLPQSLDIIMSRSADTVVVVAERLVDPDELRRNPSLVEIPAYRTSCVVEAPGGAHPCSMLDHYPLDTSHLELYADATATVAGAESYLEHFIYGAPDEASYHRLVAARDGAVS